MRIIFPSILTSLRPYALTPLRHTVAHYLIQRVQQQILREFLMRLRPWLPILCLIHCVQQQILRKCETVQETNH